MFGFKSKNRKEMETVIEPQLEKISKCDADQAIQLLPSGDLVIGFDQFGAKYQFRKREKIGTLILQGIEQRIRQARVIKLINETIQGITCKVAILEMIDNSWLYLQSGEENGGTKLEQPEIEEQSNDEASGCTVAGDLGKDDIPPDPPSKGGIAEEIKQGSDVTAMNEVKSLSYAEKEQQMTSMMLRKFHKAGSGLSGNSYPDQREDAGNALINRRSDHSIAGSSLIDQHKETDGCMIADDSGKDDIPPGPPSKGGGFTLISEVNPRHIEKVEIRIDDKGKFDQAMQSFYMSLHNEHTARAYTRHIQEFFNLFADTNPSDITVMMINLYVKYLKENGNGIATIKSKLAALSKLYSFLTRPIGASIGPIVKFNPFQNIVMPRVPMYGNSKKIDLDTAKEILNVIDQTEAIGARDYAFYLWLLLTGRRINEIRVLRKSDLRPGAGSMIVYSFQPEKTRYDYANQDEILPPPVWKAITQYWRIAERQLGEDEPIFKSESNNGKNGNEPLSDTAFRVDLKVYCCLAGIDGTDVDPHSFRHCYAQALLEMGVDLKTIQEKLGHKSVATTQVYLQSISTPEDTFWEGIMGRLNGVGKAGDNNGITSVELSSDDQEIDGDGDGS